MYMTSQSIEQLLYYLVGAKPLLTIHLFSELLNAIIISTIGNKCRRILVFVSRILWLKIKNICAKTEKINHLYT